MYTLEYDMAQTTLPPGHASDVSPREPLLATKLYIPPARSNLVSRPHLIERLNRGLTARLILISASAGFGKTTLMSEWIGSRSKEYGVGSRERADKISSTSYSLLPTPVFSWLSLDENDNDPVRFVTYFVAALRRVNPEWGRDVEATLRAPEPPPLTTIVAALINEIAAGGPHVVLVLDDYHLIVTPAIHEMLAFLLEYMPPHMHLAVLTRVDPPFSLARLRARGQLCEIREADLHFTDEEAEAFLNQVMGLRLSAVDVAALQVRAEGWVAGLQIAGLALQGLSSTSPTQQGSLPAQDHQRVSDFIRAFSGSYRYILDYLTEEVLGQQPAEIQQFLLQTSILERLCGELCDAVTGQGQAAGGQSMLEYLERANLFVVPLDNERRWYRYHHLFADLLRARLQRIQPEQTSELQRRASRWHEQHGLMDEAIGYAVAARDVEYAAALLEQQAMVVFHRGEVTLIRNWLGALPDELCRSRAALCVARAWAELVAPMPDRDLAAQWLQDAEQALGREAPGGQVAAEVTMLRPVIAFECGVDPRIVVEQSLQALAEIPDDQQRVRSVLSMILGEAYLALGECDLADSALGEASQSAMASSSPAVAFMSTYLQAGIARERGQLHRAATLCRDFIRTIAEPAERSGRFVPGSEIIDIVLGSVLLEWNQLGEAERALDKGFGQMQTGLSWHWASEAEGYMWAIRLKQAQGDMAGALALAEQVRRSPRSPIVPVLAPLFSALRVRTWLMLAESEPARLADAVRWTREQRIDLEDEDKVGTIVPLFTRDWNRLTLARLLLLQQRNAPSASTRPDLDPLLHFLDSRLAAATQEGWAVRALEALVLRALVLCAMDNLPQALVTLERALALAEPEGYVRSFTEEGPPMLALLLAFKRQQRGGERLQDYADNLIAAFGRMPGGASPPVAGPPEPPLVEPLSEREIEVLRLIAAGLSNQEIAQTLIVAAGTVKAHTASIYRKLNVSSRTQAVARARELGMI